MRRGRRAAECLSVPSVDCAGEFGEKVLGIVGSAKAEVSDATVFRRVYICGGQLNVYYACVLTCYASAFLICTCVCERVRFL